MKTKRTPRVRRERRLRAQARRARSLAKTPTAEKGLSVGDKVIYSKNIGRGRAVVMFDRPGVIVGFSEPDGFFAQIRIDALRKTWVHVKNVRHAPAEG